MKLVHISANSSSRENAIRFYGGLLGLKEIKSYSIDKELSNAIFSIPCECCVILFGNPSFSVEVFIPEQFPRVQGGFLHNCLEVMEMDDFLRKCEGAGLEVNHVPKGGRTLVFLKDFDGNLFEIKEFVGSDRNKLSRSNHI